MPYVSATLFILIPLSTTAMSYGSCSLLQFPFFFNFSLFLLNLVLCLLSPPRSLFVISSKTCLTWDALRGRSILAVSLVIFLRELRPRCLKEGRCPAKGTGFENKCTLLSKSRRPTISRGGACESI
jgi:hypothetical protein